MKKITLLHLFLSLLLFAGSTLMAQVSDTASYPYWVEMMQDENADFFATQSAFNTYWKDREITRGSGFKPFKRWEYMMQQRVNAQGKRPASDRELKAYNRFISQNKTMRNPQNEWTALGPFTVPSGYNGYRGLGRINAIGFDPLDPNVLYIGAPAGGLWKSTDHGSSWQVLTDHLPTLGVSAILADRTNPTQLFIGTGDRDAGDAPGMGVWRSVDGGLNWEPWNVGMGNATVGRLVQDAVDPLVMLAAASNGLYRSNDAGATWTRIKTGNFKEVVYHPTDHQIIYAASGANFYRSQDNGLTFTQITNGLSGGARAVIGVSPASPDVVYCLVTTSDAYKAIYRSDDKGMSFQERAISPNIMAWDCNGGSGGQAWYDLDIAVDPLNADNIIAGGVNSFRSTDGGWSWTIRSHWYGGCGVQSVHADLHVLEYHPLNNRLYVGNDGGFYWTANGGVNWTEISNGLVISQAYKIGQSQTKANFVINGYQDNGSSVMNESTWNAVGGGDGMECSYDPTDHRYSYSSVYYGAIERHFNNGGGASIAGEGTNGITEAGGWVTPYLIDHKDGNIMFIGYKNVWRSTNIKAANAGSVQWQKLSSFGNNNLEQMAQSRANTNILYVSAGNKLYYTDHVKAQTVLWTNRTSDLPSSSTITAIETHPTNEHVVYIAQQTRIFKSTDNGLNWTELTSNLSDIQINSIAYYKNSQEGLYLGTDIGVFYRDASMTEWMLFSEGLPASVKVTELELYYDETGPAGDLLRAATYGRGLWGVTPYYSSPTANFIVEDDSISAGCLVNFYDRSAGTPYTFEWSFEGGIPASSTSQHPEGISYPNPGVYDVSLTVTNPAGTHTFTWTDCIHVGEAAVPAIQFQASATTGCPGMTVSFTDQSDHCPDMWIWDIMPSTVTYLEGTSNLSQNPVIQFNEYGNYDVRLTASNANGPATLLKQAMINVGGNPLPFTESFDSEGLVPSGWNVENPDNGKSWAVKTLADGNNSAWMNFFNYTNFNQRDYLESPPMDFTGFNQISITFNYAYAQRYAQVDSLIVSISSDCGSSWERVYANGPDGQGSFETALPTVASFEPANDADWCYAGDYGADCQVIDLSAWSSMKGIKIRFETFNQYGNNLYLDNVAVSAVTQIPVVGSHADALIVYPNPAQDVIFVQTSSELAGLHLEIRDITGRLIQSQPIGQSNMKLSAGTLPAGVYFIQPSGMGSLTKKIILNR